MMSKSLGLPANYYDQGNEIGAKNVEALLVMAEGLKQLVSSIFPTTLTRSMQLSRMRMNIAPTT